MLFKLIITWEFYIIIALIILTLLTIRIYKDGNHYTIQWGLIPLLEYRKQNQLKHKGLIKTKEDD